MLLDPVGLVLIGIGLLTSWWNVGWRQGEHGQTWGKQLLGIALVSKRTYDPPGGGRGLARALVRTVLSSICSGIYGVVTVLWPLWDEDRQTLDDKIFDTLVVRWR